MKPESSVTMNDGIDSGVLLAQEVENDQSYPQPDTELPTVTATSTAMSECQNCANHKTKFARLNETYRKLKYRHRKLSKEARQLQQMCNIQVLYVII